MSKILLLLITILFASSQMLAQNKIIFSGEIKDSLDLQSLVGAIVMVDAKNATVTDKNGQFSMALEEGEYTLILSYLGYDEKTISINTKEPVIGQVFLQLSSTSLNEIIVSASSQNFNGTFKGSNYRANPLFIKNANPINTEEILRTIPGVNIIGDMGLSNRPNISIRGSWGRRSKKVLLMEDGSPAAPAPYIAPGAYYNPVSDRITSIEVYKGADMLRFGPNNMFGAVNYITALPPQKPELRVKLVGGQRNYKTGLLSYGGTWKNLGALVEGVYKNFDGFTDNSSVEILNLNAKIFSKLADNQSLYFKISGQYENNQASLSSQTPFTFDNDYKQNPFDADQFTMRRYGLDIIHKWLINSNINLTSKIFASDFERDWWRQSTTKIKATEVRNYLGEDIYQDRYRYLENTAPDAEDYVIVGQVNNGLESAGDSRWIFTVSGIKEVLHADWEAWKTKQHLEVGVKFHQEIFKDRFLKADNSRWARSGTTTKDLKYHLWSTSVYVRNEFKFKELGITPILRYEHIDMFRQDLLKLSQLPGLSGPEESKENNVYDVLLPGLTIDYQIPRGEIFGSIYKGFIAPSKVFGFLVEQNGEISNPLDGENINMKPELSLNTEIGWRGQIVNNILDGQITYFNNTINNFYAGGRHEVFQELGRINIQGIEIATGINIVQKQNHNLKLYYNMTLLKSKVQSGKLLDHDLFSQVIHNKATQKEYIEKVNANMNAFEIYVSDNSGNEVLFNKEILTESDFHTITRSTVIFGENGIENTKAPYTPPINLNTGLSYDWRFLSTGISGHYVAEQYTEYNNFNNESADGSIGKLDAYFTVDAYVNYDITKFKNVHINLFLNGKNITNNVYRASRLNRATSGIFPGGFRQIIGGINFRI